MDRGFIGCLTTADTSKAFDSVRHPRLLEKLGCLWCSLCAWLPRLPVEVTAPRVISTCNTVVTVDTVDTEDTDPLLEVTPKSTLRPMDLVDMDTADTAVDTVDTAVDTADTAVDIPTDTAPMSDTADTFLAVVVLAAVASAAEKKEDLKTEESHPVVSYGSGYGYTSYGSDNSYGRDYGYGHGYGSDRGHGYGYSGYSRPSYGHGYSGHGSGYGHSGYGYSAPSYSYSRSYGYSAPSYGYGYGH
ncbi:hypothetical protein FJT64_024194 [Amphibalanus amphitrite]|uniref:Uncharacterized protein n=1 Tax=Amphibalanus amphitrite TaxID=1232801 RepID=A0A6A4WPH4_AMPAM|nr:hypothetical protein FJT64_024194 [Amphibalanus amphitrite]